jgi:uncharacterized protein YqeY
VSLTSSPSEPVAAVRSLLRAKLRTAMKAKDRVAAGALRSVLGALDNAEAVKAPPTSTATTSEYVAAAAVGVGAAEADRRTLTAADIRTIVEREITERRAAIPEFVGGGARAEQRAAELQNEIDVLAPLLDELPA